MTDDVNVVITDFFYQYGVNMAKDTAFTPSPINFVFMEFEVSSTESDVRVPPT